MRPSLVYDSNARIVADAVRELGGEPIELGIVPDDLPALRRALDEGLATCDAVLLSGGTSKGAGDVSYRVLANWNDPGVVVHGVALKPGKPICLAATRGKPVVLLPGFPTSAIFTFHEFVAPVLRRLGGMAAAQRHAVRAELAVKINSEIGRTEYALVSLIEKVQGSSGPSAAGQESGAPPLVAWPLGKGSGSVTSFSRADGFLTIGRHEELIEASRQVEVTLLARDVVLAALTVIGSHCVGLDLLLGELESRGWRTKLLVVGSTAGLEAARRGQCDIAGIHLLDPKTGRYNEPFVTPDLLLVRGYGRMQGVVYRPEDSRFAGKEAADILAAACADPTCLMVNRNAGSGTRLLIDRLLQGAQPAGYEVQPRSHSAVAAAVAQRRADWGLSIASVAEAAGLTFAPVANEEYDFVVPRARLARPAVQAFIDLLSDDGIRQRLRGLGLDSPDT